MKVSSSCFSIKMNLLVMVLVLTSFFLPVLSAAEVIVMDTVPSAYQLARALYPQPVRSLHVESGLSQPVPEIAFMINFEYNSAVVLDESIPYLKALGDMLSMKNLKEKSLVIEGHADARGTYAYNLNLSESRARAVKHYLVGAYGIDPDRLLVIGKGNTELLDKAHPYSKVNRRVQFSDWKHD